MWQPVQIYPLLILLLTLSGCSFNSTQTAEDESLDNEVAENKVNKTETDVASPPARAQKQAIKKQQHTQAQTKKPKNSIAAIYLNQALLAYIQKSETEGYLLVSEQGLKLAYIEKTAKQQYSILLYHNKPDNSGLDFHYRDQFPLLQTTQGPWLINWPLAINDHAWQQNTVSSVEEQKKTHFLKLLKHSERNLKGLN